MASHQFVYVMNRLSKTWPGGKEVLKNISLSFLPGAKIGVLGLNGAGKSTLLKIMAGIETDFQGEAWAADGECCKNPDYMLENCPESCSQCGEINEVPGNFLSS